MTREDINRINSQYLNDCENTGEMEEIFALASQALEQKPKIDLDELKRKILMEVDGGTDDKWLRYADVCDRISDSIDEYKAESEK